jgi:uncharacterized membrane protein YphA (DoxX/SURF4 family)
MLTAFIIGRVIFGGFWIYNGYRHFSQLKDDTAYAASKGIPAPKAATIVTGIMILLGGLSILLGAYTGIGLALIIIFLVGTLVKMHDFWNETDAMSRMMSEIQFGKNLALLGACLIMYALPLPWLTSLGW